MQDHPRDRSRDHTSEGRAVFEPLAAITALLVIAAVFYLSSCDKDIDDYRPNQQKLLVVGIEGFEKEIIDAILEANRKSASKELPTLSRLAATGAWVKILPEVFGAQILVDPARTWTTFMTGQGAPAHGVTGTTTLLSGSYDEFPTPSISRQRLALWEILSHFGVEVAICGMWSTWPAEKVNGQIVSDRFFLQHFDVGPFASSGRFDVPAVRRDVPGGDRHLTWPEDLDADLLAKLRAASDPSSDRLIDKIEHAMAEIREPEQQPWRELHSAASHDRLVKLALCEMLRRAPGTRFAACYFDSLEVVSRRFLGAPGQGGGKTTPEYVEVIRSLDSHVEQLLAAMGKDTSVVLLTSHGFGRATESSNERDYTLNRLLERIDLLARTPSGDVDYARTTCFDRAITPSSTIRTLEMNFVGLRPQGSVDAADTASRELKEREMRDRLLAIGTDKKWLRPDNNQEVDSLLYQTGLEESVLEFGVCPFLRSDTRVHVGEKLVPFDELFPPRGFIGIQRAPGYLCFVPAGEGARDLSALAAPLGEESIFSVRLAPTLLALFGLPTIARAFTERELVAPPEMPQGAVLWILERAEAQRQSIRTIESYEVPVRKDAGVEERRAALRKEFSSLSPKAP